MEHRVRELALFNLGIDSKLRGCDLVALKVRCALVARVVGAGISRSTPEFGSGDRCAAAPHTAGCYWPTAFSTTHSFVLLTTL
jgi:hypothetical protein